MKEIKTYGFSLIEIMAALAILSIGMSSIMAVFPAGMESFRKARDNTVLANLMMVAGGLVFLFILSPRTGAAVLLVFPCYAFLLYKFRGRQYAVSRQISELNARNQRMFASSLGSIDLVKSNAAESRVGGAIRTGIVRETLFR
ncbi:prepilin-type N-terminal cleavage/methylation domain-containing protein, partial [bacterium]|nr:prepilin-type N-terminal cleavage/methylation domain-containing protein [bacterium]